MTRVIDMYDHLGLDVEAGSALLGGNASRSLRSPLSELATMVITWSVYDLFPGHCLYQVTPVACARWGLEDRLRGLGHAATD